MHRQFDQCVTCSTNRLSLLESGGEPVELRAFKEFEQTEFEPIGGHNDNSIAQLAADAQPHCTEQQRNPPAHHSEQ